MESLRIGIVGAGGIVRDRHMPGLAKLPGIEIKAVCNQRFESAKSFCAEFGVREIERKWEDLIARPDIDIVWIGTPPYLHAPITIAALEAGKHVFCQARMAMNLKEARAMLRAAEARPRQVTMLCPPPMGMEARRYVRKLLDEGAIGTPLHFHFRSRNGAFADPNQPAHWRQRRELSGNNMLTVGIYAEALGYWIGYPESLTAHTNVVTPERDGYRVEIPEIVLVNGRWPRGLMGTLEWSGVARHEGGDQLEIFGTEGTLVYDFSKSRLHLGMPGETALREMPVPDLLRKPWTVEADFIRAIREGGERPEPTFRTGVRYMAVTDAIHEAAASGRTVKVPES